MRKAYSYSRFSNPKQEKGDSLRRQTENAAGYCKRMGFELVELTPEKGVSALYGDNRYKGKLADFLATIKANIVKRGEVLVVESLDRLSRQEPLEALDLFREIINSGVEIHTLTPSAIYSMATIKAEPNLITNVSNFFVRAHEESRTKGDRIKENFDNKLANRRKGDEIQIHGTPPGWITIENGKPILHPIHAPTVRQIVQWGIDGLGPMAIAKRLNEAKTPLMSRKKKTVKKWEFSAIANIFNTKRVCGEYQPTQLIDITEEKTGRIIGRKRIPLGEPIEGYYPEVVSLKTWHRLQAVINSRKLTVKGRQTKGIANLFGRLLVSGDDVLHGADMGTMVLSSKRTGKLNMVSINSRDGLTPYNSFDYRAFEYAFLRWITEVRIEPQGDNADELHALRGRKVEIERRIGKVKKDLVSFQNPLAFDKTWEYIKPLEVELAKVTADVEAAEARQAAPPPSTRSILELMKDKETDQQILRSKIRAAIANCVKQIIVWISGSNLKRELLACVTLADHSTRWFGVAFRRNCPPEWADMPVSNAERWKEAHSIDKRKAGGLAEWFDSQPVDWHRQGETVLGVRKNFKTAISSKRRFALLDTMPTDVTPEQLKENRRRRKQMAIEETQEAQRAGLTLEALRSSKSKKAK